MRFGGRSLRVQSLLWAQKRKGEHPSSPTTLLPPKWAIHPDMPNSVERGEDIKSVHGKAGSLDDRQITHLICVRLRHLLYMTFLGVFWAFYIRK